MVLSIKGDLCLNFRLGKKNLNSTNTDGCINRSLSSRKPLAHCFTPPISPISATLPGVKNRLHKVKELLQWFKENGGKTGEIAIKEDGYGGVSLWATENFHKGEVILSAPKSLHFSASKVLGTKNLKAIKRFKGPTKNDWSILCLALALALESIHSKSDKWQPFISSLPSPENLNCGVIWSEEELSELWDQNVTKKAKKWREHLHKFLLSVRSSPLGSFSLDENYLAYCAAYVESHGSQFSPESPLTLTPVLDLINGDWKGNCEWEEGDSGALEPSFIPFLTHFTAQFPLLNPFWRNNFTLKFLCFLCFISPKSRKIVSTEAISKGDQLFTKYELSKEDFVLYIGMAPIFGPEGSISFKIILSDFLEYWQIEFLEEEGILQNDEFLEVWISTPISNSWDHIDPNLRGISRLIGISDMDELLNSSWDSLQVPYLEDEFKPKSALKNVLEMTKNDFLPKYERELILKDKLAYENPLTPYRQKIAIGYRGTLQEIHFLEILDKCLDQLNQ